MKNLERQGVAPKWQKDQAKIARNGKEWVDAQAPNVKGILERYVDSGALPNDDGEPPADVLPQLQRWEFDLPIELSTYCYTHLFEMEQNSLRSNNFDTGNASRGFWAGYFAELVDANKAYLYPQRFNGRFRGLNFGEGVLIAALGLLIGHRQRAETLARLLVKLANVPGYIRVNGYPTRLFCLRLFADFLGEPLVPATGRYLGYPSYEALFEVWRNPDPQVLVKLCTVICDLHTHHGYKQEDGESGDFSNLKWIYFPIEILLVFKLRQLLGLENPVIDHPLMNTPLGRLPEETPDEPDTLVQSVVARMRTEGFDEQEIIKRILDDEYPISKPAQATKDVEKSAKDEVQPFLSPAFGILLLAQPGWQENSDERYFQVIDPLTGTQFTASGYENPGIGLEQWAEARLGMLAEGMPFMKRLCPPYPVSGNGWQGIAIECRGTFPGDDKESHYLVLCLLSEQRLISFTVTASVEAFRENEALYRDVLKSRLLLTSPLSV